MAKDPTLLAHRHWLGYLQPVGLVVSPPALVQAQAFVNANVAAEHTRFLTHIRVVSVGLPEDVPAIADLRALLTDTELFGWATSDLVPADDPRAAGLEVVLPDYHETLKPTFAVADPENQGWMILIQDLPVGTDLDDDHAEGKHWQASPQTKFERLLRETGVPIGLLSNRTHLRLVYFPRGESPGYITFPVEAMSEVAGRPVLAALLMLLGADRLFTLPTRQRLPALLAESRKYQNTVSTELAEQVLAALFELLRGFQAADDQRKGELLRAVLAQEPDQVYAGLVTVLMRLVFLLYAEDRGLMADAEVYVRYYSVTGLWERLREDEGRYKDTMDQRYGAWGQLLSLFRLAHDGGRHGKFHLAARRGYLFDPDRYPFLEGRPRGDRREPGLKINPPPVSDGVLFRVLNNLLVLDGERISYRTLDVEQIGSVYEAIMGYRLEKAAGRSIALKPKKTHGAPVTVNLDALLETKPPDRGKWLAEQADQKVEGKGLATLKAADTIEGLVAALERKIARALTPNIVPRDSMVLQPSDERRRSGSHYTPRSLTGPIVTKALEPILKQLGDNPTPEQILALKVFDPAMGSAAFLVEACRQLGDVLLKGWIAHGKLPKVPDDETPELLAQRTIAQRCLYGVDKNPLAVDLAKLSLWLATLAKDHPFTFLDHSLRCGDSLVGLSREQIRRFHWRDGAQQMLTGQEVLVQRIETASRARQDILAADEFTPHALKEAKLKSADEVLNLVRFAGNLAVAAFFADDNDKKRLATRQDYLTRLAEFLRGGNLAMYPAKEERALRSGKHPIEPFHWEIEFPEVFGRENGGFDAMVGNPPFLGGTRISQMNGMAYFAWLTDRFPPCQHLCDLVGYFIRRVFALLRHDGCGGLIATNSVAHGDTREGGLRMILAQGGSLYNATRRLTWPGSAAVVVCVIHFCKGKVRGAPILDSREVRRISAYLFEGSNDESPLRFSDNPYFSVGSKIYGQGFLFADNDPDCTPLSERTRILCQHPNWSDRIRPYLVGEEINGQPQSQINRYVIYFSDLEEEAELDEWPELKHIVEEKVKPERMTLGSNPNNVPLKKRWWAYQAHRPELYAQLHFHERVLVCSLHQPHWSITFVSTKSVFSHALGVFVLSSNGSFATLQSRVHECWARFFGSSMKDDLRYTPSDCFETFPFPENFEANPALEAAGKAYYEFRASLMIRNNEGMTKTYNRFHDRSESSADIVKLRDLHADMDRAVLDAYGGALTRLTVPPCDFYLDYEDEEDEDEVPTGRQRRKPWRCRWPDYFRDEVLALLLELNKQRAEQERLAAPAEKPKKGRGKKAKPPNDGEKGIFGG